MDCTESVVIFTTLSLPVYEHGIYFHLFVSYLISSLVSYSFLKKRVKVLVAQGYPTLCNPMDCSPSGSSVPGILQARMLQWVIVSFSRWRSTGGTGVLLSTGGLPHCYPCCPVTDSCPTLSDPRDCSIPEFPFLQHLLELVQTHVIEAVMPSNPTISFSDVLFSPCLQSFPASGSFPMSQFFSLGVKLLELHFKYQSFQ